MAGLVAWTVAAAVAAVLASWAFNALLHLVWRPYAVARSFCAQGVRGPDYNFFTGNLRDIKRLRAEAAAVTLDVDDHDFIPMVQPHLRKWIALYGRMFVFWTGARPNVCLADVNAVKQVLLDRTGLYSKNRVNPHVSSLLGKGLVLIDGDDWKRHRKVVHPAFNMDKLKTCGTSIPFPSFAEPFLHADDDGDHVRLRSVHDVRVGGRAGGEGRRRQRPGGRAEQPVRGAHRRRHLAHGVREQLQGGEAGVPGAEGAPVPRLLHSLQRPDPSVQVPPHQEEPQDEEAGQAGEGHAHGHHRGLEARLANKDAAGSYGNDLLGLMLEACAPEHGGELTAPTLSMDEIIDECKTFFFAGHDTTSHLLTWASFLLSTHPEWQGRLREEVHRECGDAVPTGNALNRLKLVNMFLLETLRLYGPVTLIRRRASADLELGGVRVPEGAILTIPIATIHRDKEVWGEDAGEFRPERFENGVTRAAKHPNALLSFSSGPRSCIGQNFAMIEAGAVVAMILQRFELKLPPKYVHAPMDVITLRPRHGLPMLLRRL